MYWYTQQDAFLEDLLVCPAVGLAVQIVELGPQLLTAEFAVQVRPALNVSMFVRLSYGCE
jgi:hypothetical protein